MDAKTVLQLHKVQPPYCCRTSTSALMRWPWTGYRSGNSAPNSSMQPYLSVKRSMIPYRSIHCPALWHIPCDIGEYHLFTYWFLSCGNLWLGFANKVQYWSTTGTRKTESYGHTICQQTPDLVFWSNTHIQIQASTAGSILILILGVNLNFYSKMFF